MITKLLSKLFRTEKSDGEETRDNPVSSQTAKIQTATPSANDTSDSSRQPQHAKKQHHHVPKLFALADSTPENHKESQASRQQQASKAILQLVDRGEGKERMVLSNFVGKDAKDTSEKQLSLYRPILVRDTPESIGMKIPKGRNSRKRKRNDGTSCNSSETTNHVPFSIQDVAAAVGKSSPVQVINILKQELDEDLSDWTFRDLVGYFEDRERLTEKHEKAPLSVSPTGRSRRKAAIRSQESTSAIIHDEKSSGEASTRILNQISFEFSGTPLHSMVRSPKLVRDIDWIDKAWPEEKKSQRKNKEEKGNGQTNSCESSTTKTAKKVSKGGNSLEYPAVQYYCLTSAAGSYTDFHIDFGGSTVWYHVVRGQKIFVASPPTSENLRVYEEWLCHPNQEKIFLPDLIKERACPGTHSYSSSDMLSSMPSISNYSSVSTATTHADSAALGDLKDEMAFFRNSLKNTLATNNALRFTLNAGETLILPGGWIHAVYTPVDALVFGGNFLHGMDIQMQLTVNAIEARSRVLDQYRFPHFGALQMYAGGMYLKRLRELKKYLIKPNKVNSDGDNGIGSTRMRTEDEGQNKRKIRAKSVQSRSDSNKAISPQELEELPMLINALEFWWLSCDTNEIRKVETNAHARDSRNYDSITSHASFRDAAEYVTKENQCQSVEDFIATFRKEYARVSNGEGESYRVASSTDSTGQSDQSSSPPVHFSSTHIATKKFKQKSSNWKPKKKKARPNQKKNRKGASELDDPLDVVLSKQVKDYLASIQITTAAQLLMARTTDVAKGIPEWRKRNGMKDLKGRAGAQATVSTWKRNVRNRALEVGANKLAKLNIRTNMKPPKPDKKADRKLPPSVDTTE